MTDVFCETKSQMLGLTEYCVMDAISRGTNTDWAVPVLGSNHIFESMQILSLVESFQNYLITSQVLQIFTSSRVVEYDLRIGVNFKSPIIIRSGRLS